MDTLAIAAASVVAYVVINSVKRRRREIPRSKDGWRGSTMYGYVYGQYNERGTWVPVDNKLYKYNFRMSMGTVQHVHERLSAKGFCVDSTPRNPAHQVPGLFKVCVALYYMGHCKGTVKFAADAASLGESTVQAYVDEFCDGVIAVLGPEYMPATPRGPEYLKLVRENFAARRGVPNVAMAVDGTHVPFKVDDATTASDYLNYKHWHSILVLAFVDSLYCFVDATVGHPGKCGDNGLLQKCWLMDEIAKDPEGYLGPDGVIAADGGASDHGGFLLNPINAPTSTKEHWYNFAHSSTRFFVEQTFGMWKNRSLSLSLSLFSLSLSPRPMALSPRMARNTFFL